jgi:hypothetical protein
MQAANVRCHKQVLERLTSKLTSKLVLEPKRLTILTNQSCWYNKEADVAAIAKFRKVELTIRLKPLYSIHRSDVTNFHVLTCYSMQDFSLDCQGHLVQ